MRNQTFYAKRVTTNLSITPVWARPGISWPTSTLTNRHNIYIYCKCRSLKMTALTGAKFRYDWQPLYVANKSNWVFDWMQIFTWLTDALRTNDNLLINNSAKRKHKTQWYTHHIVVCEQLRYALSETKRDGKIKKKVRCLKKKQKILKNRKNWNFLIKIVWYLKNHGEGNEIICLPYSD